MITEMSTGGSEKDYSHILSLFLSCSARTNKTLFELRCRQTDHPFRAAAIVVGKPPGFRRYLSPALNATRPSKGVVIDYVTFE